MFFLNAKKNSYTVAILIFTSLFMFGGCALFKSGGKEGIAGRLIKKSVSCVVSLSKSEQLYVLQNTDSVESLWTEKEKGFKVRIIASKQLNAYNQLSHALIVGVYQLSTPDVIVKEIATKSGLRRLLTLLDLDKSVLQYDMQTIQPRSSARLDISRKKGARYLLIVTGFNSLISNKVVRLIQLPLVRNTRSVFNPVNWFTEEPKPFPGDLDIFVRLGEKSIQDFVVQARDECS